MMTQAERELVARRFAYFEQADAIRVEGGPILTWWHREKVTGEYDHRLLEFSWMDEDSYDYRVYLDEECFLNMTFTGNKVRCLDDAGVATNIELWTLQPIIHSEP